jgi:cytochrome b subunit of formate dehydrogenase
MTSKLKTNLIKATLDTSTSQLTPSTLEKLHAARTHALAHQRTKHAAPAFAWIGNHDDTRNSSYAPKTIHWAVAALFVACLISGASIWHDYTTEHEISEVDVSILTGDIPLHAYLD